jgi:hypothetical protein
MENGATSKTGKRLSGVVTVTADDGAEEMFHAHEVGLNASSFYTAKRWWEAICDKKGFSLSQTVELS